MTARLYIGDVFDRMTQLDDASYDLIITSPPFLALRSYLPDDHPLKDKEIGSEATPAAFLDVMLALTARWGELLAPHGSIAIEIGDTYSGSGGAGGDYNPDGLRAGQQKVDGPAARAGGTLIVEFGDTYCGAGGYGSPDSPNPAYGNGKRSAEHWEGRSIKRFKKKDDGWPEAKSLCMIPEMYAASLAYGRNLLRKPMTAREMLDYAEGWVLDHPDASAIDLLRMLRNWFDRYAVGTRGPVIEYERWRVRNFKPWIRSNPPVGALGDKERPATSYITVATRNTDRYFDLDAVRTAPAAGWRPRLATKGTKGPNLDRGDLGGGNYGVDPAGAPPLDWWHPVDALIDNIIDQRAGKGANRRTAKGTDSQPRTGKSADRDGNWADLPELGETNGAVGARGVHIRRELEAAGYLQTLDALDVSPKGYAGAHYAVWPPLLVKLLLQEMCPRRVCTTCGKPSRRIVETERVHKGKPVRDSGGIGRNTIGGKPAHDVADIVGMNGQNTHTTRETVGWSDCGHNTWRPARILDPFGGSGTTGAVATGMGVDCDLIDLDERNADLTRERIGMFLEVIERETVA